MHASRKGHVRSPCTSQEKCPCWGPAVLDCGLGPAASGPARTLMSVRCQAIGGLWLSLHRRLVQGAEDRGCLSKKARAGSGPMVLPECPCDCHVSPLGNEAPVPARSGSEPRASAPDLLAAAALGFLLPYRPGLYVLPSPGTVTERLPSPTLAPRAADRGRPCRTVTHHRSESRQRGGLSARAGSAQGVLSVRNHPAPSDPCITGQEGAPRGHMAGQWQSQGLAPSPTLSSAANQVVTTPPREASTAQPRTPREHRGAGTPSRGCGGGGRGQAGGARERPGASVRNLGSQLLNAAVTRN